MIVLDTNVALDLLVFDDPACVALREALDAGRLRWIATVAMREEFARVLGYPAIAAQLDRRSLGASDVLAAFDAYARMCDAPPSAPCRCDDPDDQVFIDLALAQGARLASKDKAVLAMRRRLAPLGVHVMRVEALRIALEDLPGDA